MGFGNASWFANCTRDGSVDFEQIQLSQIGIVGRFNCIELYKIWRFAKEVIKVLSTLTIRLLRSSGTRSIWFQCTQRSPRHRWSRCSLVFTLGIMFICLVSFNIWRILRWCTQGHFRMRQRNIHRGCQVISRRSRGRRIRGHVIKFLNSTTTLGGHHGPQRGNP